MVGDPPRGEERQKVGVSVQQQSTATTELFSTFAFIQMRPDQRKQGSRRLLRGVRDEEVAGSNPVTPTTVLPCQSGIPRSVRELLSRHE
jgi:hypothetical protein